MITPRVHVIKWLDSGLSIADGWMSPSAIVAHDNHMVVSVGFLMYEDDDRVILTGTYAPDLDQHLNAQSIVKSAITSREAVSF